jgi:hypothetical protein
VGSCPRSNVRAKNEVKNLHNIVIALEVGQNWVPAQHFKDNIGELLFPPVELFLRD